MSEPETPHGWSPDHYTYQCADGQHNSFWRTVIESPEWKAWSKEVGRRMRFSDAQLTARKLHVWDVDECAGAGWISPEHFYDFVKFLRTKKAIRCRNAKKAGAK